MGQEPHIGGQGRRIGRPGHAHEQGDRGDSEGEGAAQACRRAPADDRSSTHAQPTTPAPENAPPNPPPLYSFAVLAKPAPEYELVLMLDPELPDDRRNEIAVEARRRIEGSGELKQERSWGLRKLAYEIKQRTEADYRFFRFAKDGNLLDDLNHSLKIADGVLRFRIYKVEPDAPVIDPPPPFTLAATSQRAGGGRGRRDEERPPRGPEPSGEPQGEGESAPAAAESASSGDES